MSISQAEIKFIRQACASNFRSDGRSNITYRPYNLISPTTSPILSNGSSRLFLPASNTDILCSIKAEIVHPPFLKSEGVIDLNVDILPYASQSKDRKDIRAEEQELTSTLSNLLLPHLLNRDKLVVLRGRYVWRLNIDVLVTHCDGNLMDACSIAIYGAMQNLKLPSVVPVEKVDHAVNTGKQQGKKASDEIMLDSDVANSVTPDGVLDCPIVVTICLMPLSTSQDNVRKVSKKNESVMVVDCNRQEEACSTSRISFSIDRKGNISGIHKYGSSSVLTNASSNIKFDMLVQIQNAALSCSRDLFQLLQKCQEKAANDSANTSEDAYANFFKGQFELQ